MSATDSVRALIARLRCRDEKAAESLWTRYFVRLVELARGKLRSTRPVSIDEEDIALESLLSLSHGLRSGKFPHIDNRVDLWTLLVVITRSAFVGEASESMLSIFLRLTEELSTFAGVKVSFQSWRVGRSRLMVGCRAIIRQLAVSPGSDVQLND